MSETVYTTYIGLKNKSLVYVGTTIQKPADRFRWHKHNGKPFDFIVVGQYDTKEEMLEREFALIKKFNPKYNKIKHRTQNLNRKLSTVEHDDRVGDSQWCQRCLRRRVNSGYDHCMWCTRKKEFS